MSQDEVQAFINKKALMLAKYPQKEIEALGFFEVLDHAQSWRNRRRAHRYSAITAGRSRGPEQKRLTTECGVPLKPTRWHISV